MQVTIKPSKPKGVIQAPPSKSMAHRLLICAGLSKGTSKVCGISFSQDVLATLDCLEVLGAKYTADGNDITITGINPSDFNGARILDCRECGSTLRFMIPICMTSGAPVSLTGSSTLMQRPLTVYEDIAAKHGLKFNLFHNTLELQGPLKSGTYEITGGISSQFVSGLLFALPLLEGDSVLKLIPPIESQPYINMTLDALSRFGIKITKEDENTYLIKGGQTYTPCNVIVEGDYSNAAFLEALNFADGNVTVTGLNPQSYQGDKVYNDYYQKIQKEVCVLDISDCPDLGPVLFVVSAFFEGAFFVGIKRLKWKESDRVSAMMQELLKCGIHMTIEENRLQVHGNSLKKPKQIISGHNDHRIVMAMAVILVKVGGTIDGAEAVQKSYPDFFDRLKSLGVEVEIDGMDK